MQKTPRFKVGQRFKTRGKHPSVCTIVDILRTFNLAGECVSLRYVATHEFCGQTVTDHDVVDTTIAKGLIAD
jgi:hypothetical protein